MPKKTTADSRGVNIFCVLSEKEFNRPDFDEFFKEKCGLLLVESAPEGFMQDLRKRNSKTIALLTANPYFAVSDLFWGDEGPIPPENVRLDWVLKTEEGKVRIYRSEGAEKR